MHIILPNRGTTVYNHTNFRIVILTWIGVLTPQQVKHVFIFGEFYVFKSANRTGNMNLINKRLCNYYSW